MLSAHRTEAAQARQDDFDGGQVQGGRDALAALIDRLSARLGDGAVLRPALKDSHIPERSETWTPAGPDPELQTPGVYASGPRPLFLLDPPEPIQTTAGMPDSPPAQFSWRRVTRKIARAEGPERLSPEWWRAPVPDLPEDKEAPVPETDAEIEQARIEKIRKDSEALEREDAGAARDYYRVEDEHGRRYWLFRQGLYDHGAPERMPSWWMHGVFA